MALKKGSQKGTGSQRSGQEKSQRGSERETRETREQGGTHQGQQRGAWRTDERGQGRGEERMGQGGRGEGEQARWGRGEPRGSEWEEDRGWRSGEQRGSERTGGERGWEDRGREDRSREVRGREERGLRRGESGRQTAGLTRARSPFQEMERMFGPLGQFMMSPFLQRGGWSGLEQMWPSTDVYLEDDALVVKADLPGMRKEDVEVSIDRGDLVVSGERRHESEVDERNVYRSECAYGSFYRRVPLPEGADPDHVEARFRDGVLEVKVPVQHDERTERRRRIDIR